MKFVYKESLSTTTISNKSTPGKAEWKNIALNFPILWWPLICRQESERKYNMWPHYFWPSFLSMSHWRLICMCPLNLYFDSEYFLFQWTFQLEVWQGAICKSTRISRQSCLKKSALILCSSSSYISGIITILLLLNCVLALYLLCVIDFLLFFLSENYKHTRRKDVNGLRNNLDSKSSFNSQSVQTVVNSSLVNNSLKSSPSISTSSSLSSLPPSLSSSSSFQTSSKSSSHNHRQKRSTSYKRNVEVMVAADNKMLRYHGDDLERYILTLMSIVSRGFRGKRNLFWIFNVTAILQLANMCLFCILKYNEKNY